MEEKRGFFKNIWTSIKDFEKYEEFAADKLTKAIKYIVLLTLIFTAIVTLMYTYKFYTVVKDAREFIAEKVDDIALENGKLNVIADGPIVIENEKNVIPIIIIDTEENVNTDSYKEKIRLYDTGLLVLNDRVVVVSKLLTQEESIYYTNVFTNKIESKQDFINILSGGNIMYAYMLFGVTIFVYLFIIYLTSNLVDAIVLGVLGYLFARIVKLRLRFKATFNIGIHALTLPMILNLIYIMVNTFTNFTITHFQWMYTSISYIYVAVAILMIKTEIINQRIQLIKLQEIQEKTAKEEPEIEEEPKEKEKKEEKEDKEDEKEQDQGEQPEGSNA